MRLSNYIYCTLTPSVCGCETHCTTCMQPNGHTKFLLVMCTLLRCTAKAKFAANFTLVCTLHSDRLEQPSCLIHASKERKHTNVESTTVFLLVHALSFCVNDCYLKKLSKLSNRWHVTLSLWLSQCSADEAFDSSGNNLGLDRLSNLFIETVQSQQTCLYIHLMSLNVQLRLSPTISTMDSGLKDIANRWSSVLV